MANPDQPLIASPGEFRDLCAELRKASQIAFDTEFIPERTYTPELCLVQVATDSIVAAIDPIALGDVSEFWNVLVETPGEVIVHAGKHEMDFCVQATGRLPSRFADVQLAAGFVGFGHPTAYSNLVHRVLGSTVRSGETRTDWSARPLSAKQIQYALDDVRYLIPLWTEVSRVLHERGRTDWYTDERDGQFRSLLLDPAQRTRRITGGGGLNPRSAAVLREIVAWREERARQLNRPPRWIVRDDIVSELAKRQPSTIEELKSTRGLAIDNKSTWARDLLAAIHRGLDLPDDQLPQPAHRRETTDEQMVVKILAAAMIQRGSELGIATGLIGSNEDLREMLDWYRRGSSDTDRPSLVQQWREDVVGKYLRQILAGHVVARIITDDDGIELRFEPVPPIC